MFMHHNFRKMNKLIGITHKIRDLGKIQMATRVTGRNKKSIGIKHWQSGGNSRTIYSTILQLLHSCDVAEEEQADMSVLQKNDNPFSSRHVSKTMSQATDWRVTSWASCQWTASFLFVAWQETRLPYWLVRQAYKVHFCLASFKKIKQCTVVRPLHSAVVACLWGAIPSSVFQTALEMFLSLFPHWYHMMLSKFSTQTFQTRLVTCALGVLDTCLEALESILQKLISAEINGNLPVHEGF